MVKNTEKKSLVHEKLDLHEDIQSKPDMKQGAVKLLYGVFVVGVIYGLWQNPQFFSNLVSNWSARLENTASAVGSEDTILLRQEVDSLQNKISLLENQLGQALFQANQPVDLSRFDEKIEAIEKQNLNVIDSKADVATVLGILHRLDKIEAKLDHLAKISDDGALLLTATMMIKDSADKGNTFEYEADVLQQLAQNDKVIQSDVAYVVRVSHESIKSLEYLQAEFADIYKLLAKLQYKQNLEGKNWKEVLNIKLNEVVKVKRVDNHETEVAESTTENILAEVAEQVKLGALAQALDTLEQLKETKFMADNDLQLWMVQAKNRVMLEQAVKHIATHSLAMMKVNSLKAKKQLGDNDDE